MLYNIYNSYNIYDNHIMLIIFKMHILYNLPECRAAFRFPNFDLSSAKSSTKLRWENLPFSPTMAETSLLSCLSTCSIAPWRSREGDHGTNHRLHERMWLPDPQVARS